MTNPEHKAYPTESKYYECLTKRELFSAMLLQGLLANSQAYHVSSAQDAVGWADDLIKALNEVQ